MLQNRTHMLGKIFACHAFFPTVYAACVCECVEIGMCEMKIGHISLASNLCNLTFHIYNSTSICLELHKTIFHAKRLGILLACQLHEKL